MQHILTNMSESNYQEQVAAFLSKIHSGIQQYRESLRPPQPGADRYLAEDILSLLTAPDDISQFVQDWAEAQLDEFENCDLTLATRLGSLEYSATALLAICNPALSADSDYLARILTILSDNDAQYLMSRDTGHITAWPDSI